jgi:hypothetical protein
MKTSLFIGFGILLAVLCSSAEPPGPAGSIRFRNAEVPKVLDIYKALTGADLIIDLRVKGLPYGISLRASGEDKTVVAKLPEKALLQQAGVLITRLDDGKVSVTCNDALPVSPSAEPLSKEQGTSATRSSR